MLIFILGYMGSGKSTAGKKLAGKLGYEFYDMDTLFEEKLGTSVASYFADHGEASFRKQEKEVLSALLHQDKLVIATGGGTPCFFDNMEVMNSFGITIYLNMEPKALFHRLTQSKTSRPLLQKFSGPDLLDKIQQDLSWRAPFYQRARYIISGEDLKYSQILEFLNA